MEKVSSVLRRKNIMIDQCKIRHNFQRLKNHNYFIGHSNQHAQLKYMHKFTTLITTGLPLAIVFILSNYLGNENQNC